jgi:hypothetical protein
VHVLDSSQSAEGVAPALAAAVLAFASAAVTAFWLLGGTIGLDTVGGQIEEQARERSTPALAALAVTLVAKLAAGAESSGRAEEPASGDLGPSRTQFMYPARGPW